MEVVEGDIRRVGFARFDGSLDLISGGPPCQPFSLGGRHRAYDDARDMFPQAVRALREARPKAFVFEYVQLQMEHPEMVAKHDENWEDHLARLERHHTSSERPGLHYRVVTRLLNSANYGVPQKRERVLFVGFRDDIDARWSFETGDHTMEALVWDQTFGDYWERHKIAKKDRRLEGRSLQLSRKLSAEHRLTTKPWKTTRDAIADLPDPQRVRQSASVLNHKFQGGARAYPGHTGSYLEEPAQTLKAGVHGVSGGENMLRRADGSVRYWTCRGLMPLL